MSILHFDGLGLTGMSGSVDEILEMLKNTSAKQRKQDIEMQQFEKNTRSTVYNSIRYNREKYPTNPPIMSLLAAMCPHCENVDNRFELSKYETSSTIKTIDDYPGAGYELECRCCKTQFRFCGYPIFPNKRQNSIVVSKEFCREVLHVEY